MRENQNIPYEMPGMGQNNPGYGQVQAPYGYQQGYPNYGYAAAPQYSAPAGKPAEKVDILELEKKVPEIPRVYKPLSAFLTFILALVFSLPLIGYAAIIPCYLKAANLNLKAFCKAYIGVNATLSVIVGAVVALIFLL